MSCKLMKYIKSCNRSFFRNNIDKPVVKYCPQGDHPVLSELVSCIHACNDILRRKRFKLVNIKIEDNAIHAELHFINDICKCSYADAVIEDYVTELANLLRDFTGHNQFFNITKGEFIWFTHPDSNR